MVDTIARIRPEFNKCNKNVILLLWRFIDYNLFISTLEKNVKQLKSEFLFYNTRRAFSRGRESI